MVRICGNGLGKRGSAVDLIFVIVVALFFAVVILISFAVMSEFNTQIQAHSDIPTEAKTASTTLTGDYTGIVDNMFLIFMVIMAIGALILAALVRIHPIFIPLFIIVLIFIVFMAGVFSNIYQEMAGSDQLLTYGNQLTMTTNIMVYLPIIVAVIGTLLMIVQYKSYQNAQ